MTLHELAGSVASALEKTDAAALEEQLASLRQELAAKQAELVAGRADLAQRHDLLRSAAGAPFAGLWNLRVHGMDLTSASSAHQPWRHACMHCQGPAAEPRLSGG